MDCILHIGTEKTGTTSFQALMWENRDTLLAAGILYPTSLGKIAHRALPSSVMNPQNEGLAAVATTSAQVEEKLSRELAAHPNSHTCLISSEHLHSRLRTPEELGRLYKLLYRCFDQVTIYLHLRPQIDMLISLASTAARHESSVGKHFFDRAHAGDPYYNYFDLVRMWQDCFGAEALRLVSFRREPDLSLRLFADLGLDRTMLPAAPKSNGPVDIQLMALINTMVRAGHKPRLGLDFIENLPVTQPLRPSRAFATNIQDRFAASNAQLAALRPDMRLEDLTPDWSRYPEQGNEALLDMGCAFPDVLAALTEACFKARTN